MTTDEERRLRVDRLGKLILIPGAVLTAVAIPAAFWYNGQVGGWCSGGLNAGQCVNTMASRDFFTNLSGLGVVATIAGLVFWLKGSDWLYGKDEPKPTALPPPPETKIKLPRHCPECGAKLDGPFCASCGAKIG